MKAPGAMVIREGDSFACSVLRIDQSDFGIPTADIVSPPRRFWPEGQPPVAPVEPDIDLNRLSVVPTPSALLGSLPPEHNWSSLSRRSVGRLRAHFFVCEDPQRRLDRRAVRTLAHQVSLVQHVLEQPRLSRALIADEVGLGKTVEAGLLIQRLLEAERSVRVLYLAPARLVSNVRQELDRLGLPFRQWTAGDADARLTDQLIVASIHKAALGSNAPRLRNHGPWDVLVVDECHHLSDWAPGGGDPKENFKLVRGLIAQQGESGRVLLLSGTPHQGHRSRFENLVQLLMAPGESSSALAGRVIYRTKEDVRDWNGEQLFPTRQINPPLTLDLGDRYRAWIRAIHAFYHPDDGARDTRRRRAMGWRCAQALQWAASSPQAGLGYLVRQALRADRGLKDGCLSDAIKALRPYRGGRADEPVEALFDRLTDEIRRQSSAGDIEDIEEDDDVSAADVPPSRDSLDALLRQGIEIRGEVGDAKWRFLKERVLDATAPDKVVLFAQPIETVMALRDYLIRTFNEDPALIVGGQKDADRRDQVRRFWKTTGPRFLVSSRAGGEGLNLQVAHRLIHVDVPWNPMELEQRVGRVHRFGSRKTIVVDTLVVKNSREEDAYRVAREKLREIMGTLVPQERVEQMFSRVMSLVRPEDLQHVLIQDAVGPLHAGDQDQLAALVQQGYGAWREFHDQYAATARSIREQDPGTATWGDLGQLIVDHGLGSVVDGFESVSFVAAGGGLDRVGRSAHVLHLRDGRFVACGDYVAPVVGAGDITAEPVGLNDPAIGELLRQLAFPELPVGAAHLRWPADSPIPGVEGAAQWALLALLRQTVRAEGGAWMEQANTLHLYHLTNDSETIELVGAQKVHALRALSNASPRVRPGEWHALVQWVGQEETRLVRMLRQRSPMETDQRVRHAVVPLFAAVVEPHA